MLGGVRDQLHFQSQLLSELRQHMQFTSIMYIIIYYIIYIMYYYYMPQKNRQRVIKEDT